MSTTTAIMKLMTSRDDDNNRPDVAHTAGRHMTTTTVMKLMTSRDDNTAALIMLQIKLMHNNNIDDIEN